MYAEQATTGYQLKKCSEDPYTEISSLLLLLTNYTVAIYVAQYSNVFRPDFSWSSVFCTVTLDLSYLVIIFIWKELITNISRLRQCSKDEHLQIILLSLRVLTSRFHMLRQPLVWLAMLSSCIFLHGLWDWSSLFTLFLDSVDPDWI